MSNNNVEQLFERREELKTECKQLYEELERTYSELNENKDRADKTIDSAQNLISSIKRTPMEFSRTVKLMEVEERDYEKNSQILRAQQKDMIRERVEAVGAIGIAGAGLLTIGSLFKDFINGTGGKAIDLKRLIFAVAFVLLLLIYFLILRSLRRRKAAKETMEDIVSLEDEKRDIQIRIKKAEILDEKITTTMNVVNNILKAVNKYQGCSYKSIPNEDQINLHSLVNYTLSLAKMLNE